MPKVSDGVSNANPYLGKPETTLTLPVTMLRLSKGAFLSAIIPRMFLIIFRYCQPVLINAAVRFVHNGNENSNDRNYGYWLIVMAGIIYFGLAVSINITVPLTRS